MCVRTIYIYIYIMLTGAACRQRASWCGSCAASEAASWAGSEAAVQPVKLSGQ